MMSSFVSMQLHTASKCWVMHPCEPDRGLLARQGRAGAGHLGGKGWRVRGRGQRLQTLGARGHHRTTMLQLTCWEAACGSATQSCATSDAEERAQYMYKRERGHESSSVSIRHR